MQVIAKLTGEIEYSYNSIDAESFAITWKKYEEKSVVKITGLWYIMIKPLIKCEMQFF